MTEAPDFFPDPPGQPGQPAPDGNEAALPDLLSGMLRNVRLRGEDIYCCTPVAPFAISFGHQGGTLHMRAWAIRPDATAGWLTGAMDPVIGDAITSIHANPAHPWTIERLAGKSNLSRSAFADRFASRVGTPPAAYIAQVRLENAADLLQYTTQSISAIAHQIGYDSEAAFSRAFSKRYGVPPSRWRRRAATPDTTTMRAE